MRVAAVDVGSNTVKLTIAEVLRDGQMKRIFETAVTTRLGEGMHARRLREAAIRRTVDALRSFVVTCHGNDVDEIAAVGTSALRDASNQTEFVDRVRDIGLEVVPIPGEEEARLSYLAVRRDPLWEGAGPLLVVDIGGGSTEIIWEDSGPGGCPQWLSLPLGGVRITEAALRSDPPTIVQMDEANTLALDALQVFRPHAPNLTAVGVGGTLTNIASVHLKLADRDPDRVHGTCLSTEDIEAQIDLYGGLSVEERRSIAGLDPARADIILGGAIVLSRVLNVAAIDACAVSCRGLRWGVLYDRFGTTRN